MKYPLIPVAIAFALGILSANFIQLTLLTLSVITLGLLLIAMVMSNRRREYVYIPLLAASFVLGAARLEYEELNLPTPVFNDYFIRGVQIHGKVQSCELPAKGNLSFSVLLDSVTSAPTRKG